MKKALAMLLCAVMLMTACAFAEELDSDEIVTVYSTNGYAIQAIVPEGYDCFNYDMGRDVPIDVICFQPMDPDLPIMLLTVNYDEETNGATLNQFSNEEIAAYKDQVLADMDMINPSVSLTETAYGTKVIVFNENSEYDEYVIISTLYQGCWIDLMLYRDDYSKPISEEDIENGIALLSETWLLWQGTEEDMGMSLAGGWTAAEDWTLTDALRDTFNKAFTDIVGASYEPIALVGTQVVAGINYRFFAKQTLITATPVIRYGFVTIYQDTEGNISFTDFQQAD